MRKFIICLCTLYSVLCTLNATETTLYSEEFTCADDWSSGYALVDKAALSGATAGDQINVYVTAISSGTEWPQVYLQFVNAAWSWVDFADTHNYALSGQTAPHKASIELTQTMLDSVAAGNYLVVKGAGYTANLITLTHEQHAAGENDTIWTGHKDFGNAWSEWETLPASLFANAVEGQLLRFRFTDLRAGAQLKVGRSDWEVMDDTEIVNLRGRYQDFTITATMLAELKARGSIISGLGFTLTEVMLLNPASLKPLTLSVPVTDNWTFAARPSLTIHVENPYDEAVVANAEILISTDKMAPVDTLTARVTVAANGAENIILTTDADLVAGFYQATCIVNDDLARAFVFAINPTAVISAPDAQPDFATYWAAAKNQLATIDMNPVLTEITAKSTAARKVYLVEFNSVPDSLTGDPVVVRGYYCEPQDGQPHPVIMHYLGYDSGYRPGGQDVKPYCPSGDAEPTYAEFYLSTRGQSINNRAAGEREADGKGDFVNTYGDWFAFNFGKLDGYYYRGAFMDCIQAIRFMATRPTSDMTNLFGEGQSQGGAFTYAAAALSDLPFRAIAPGIAFLGDFPDYFDIVNWPAYVARAQRDSLGWTDEQMYTFLSYFDTKNLAPSISAATLACLGLQDNICPPHTNIAPYNNLTVTDKQLIINPELMHQVAGTWYNEMMAFFAAHIVSPGEAIDHTNLQSEIINHKYIKDGQLLIVRDSRTYNALGQITK